MSFPTGTEMFQFPAFASFSYFIQKKIPCIDAWKRQRPELLPAALTLQAPKVGFPIRKSTDQRVFAPPRGLSQRITSFFACACQGIHQLPLRRLIVLIANARRLPVGIGRKDQLLEICSMACGQAANQVQKGERPAATNRFCKRNPNKSSLHDVAEQADDTRSAANFFSLRMTGIHQGLVEPDGIEPTTPCLQSRCSPS